MPYAPAVVERTMKVQEVLMQAISGQLTWLQAEEILGWRPRTLRRWRLRYQRVGYDGLWDRRRQQPSPRRAPVAEVARIVRLYRERYAGFNAAHFHEIAQREHQVPYAYTFVKRLLQAAQLLPKRRPVQEAQPETAVASASINTNLASVILSCPAGIARSERHGSSHRVRSTGRSVLAFEDPRIPLDNNATERSLRGMVVGRKNHYGSRSKRGTEVSALFFSLIESAKLCGVEPKAYLLQAVRAAFANPGTVTLPHTFLTN